MHIYLASTGTADRGKAEPPQQLTATEGALLSLPTPTRSQLWYPPLSKNLPVFGDLIANSENMITFSLLATVLVQVKRMSSRRSSDKCLSWCRKGRKGQAGCVSRGSRTLLERLIQACHESQLKHSPSTQHGCSSGRLGPQNTSQMCECCKSIKI